MNSKFLPIQFNDSQQSSDKILIQNGCFIKPKQESEFGSQNNIENQEEEKHEIRTNQKYVWDNTELLRYIIFLENYTDEILQMRKYDYAMSIYNKMTRFIESKIYLSCRDFHNQQFKKVPDLARLIQNIKENLYITKEEVLYETKRIDQFFQKDLEGQLNSFKTKKSFLIESSNSEICEIAKNIQQLIIKDQQEKEEKGQKGFFDEDDEWRKKEIASLQKCQKKQSYLIEIPIQLYICFKKEEETKKSTNLRQQTGQNTSLKSDGFSKMSEKHVLSYPNIKKNEKQIMKEPNFDDEIFEDENAVGDFKDKINEERKGKDSLSNVEEIIEQQREDTSQFTESNSRKLNMWTVSENMKFFAFLAINYQAFLIENTFFKQNIFKKIRDFIGTNKTQEHCSNHFKDMKTKSTSVLSRLIKEEGKNFKITQKFINELKNFISDHTKIVNIEITKDILLTLEIQPTVIQVPQKEKIQIFMEKVLACGMEINSQISTSMIFQNIESSIIGKKCCQDSLTKNEFFFKHPKTLKGKVILSLPENIIKKLEKKKDLSELLVIKFNHIIEVKFNNI